ncbi:MAG: hypothetical protein WCI05_11785, partial [Myxococcales bacterium]
MMRNIAWLQLAALIAVLVLLTGCSSQREAEPTHSADAGTSQAAREAIADIRSRFVLRATPQPMGLPGAAIVEPKESPVLRPAVATRIVREGNWLRPEIPDTENRHVRKRAEVRLADRASGAFELRDVESGMTVGVALEDSTDAVGEEADGYVIYRGGHRAGGHVVHRMHAEGTEDYVTFDAPPERNELRYRVTLGEKVAGLRLVSHVLEFLDAGGMPRLRMKAPGASDQSGGAHALTLSVIGCHVDSSPALPWTRPVIAPGFTECVARVAWTDAATYPLLVDPGFEATGSLAQPREGHTATLLPTGDILVVGGNYREYSCWRTLAGAEVVHSDGTIAYAGILQTPRVNHTATGLGDGRVLVVGGYQSGCNQMPPPSYAEIWSSAGVFQTAGQLVRNRHTATLLADGRVLVIGGYGVGADDPLCGGVSACPVAAAWQNAVFSAAGTLLQVREYHTATLLADGRVLVIGGSSRSAEVWQGGSFQPAGDLLTVRYGHTSTRLPDGSVLVAGGYSSPSYLTSFEKWQGGVFQSLAATMTLPRGGHIATALPDGRVLITGGGVNGERYAELWNSGSVYPAGTLMYAEPVGNAASGLADGRVAIIGGHNSAGYQTSGIDIWSDKTLPQVNQLCNTQNAHSICVTGYCIGGACCDRACNNTWETCSSQLVPGQTTGISYGICSAIPCSLGCPAGSTCVDGVCCESACTGPCMACIQTKTGQFSGYCRPILANTDPDNECAASGSGICQLPGVCDGNGACKTTSGTTCSSGSSCASQTTVQQSSTCDATGNCVAGSTSNCSPFKCSGTACLTSCSTSNDCQSPYQCVNGQCGTGKTNGNTCTSGSECTSGFCTEGVCCNEGCTETCRSCVNTKSGGTTGTCASIPVGANPKTAGTCTVSGNLCSSDGKCDGTGSCRSYAPSGTTCGATTCSGLSVSGFTCNGGGTCVQQNGVSCAPYACKTGACLNSCAAATDCAPGNYCNAGACVLKKTTGDACQNTDQCSSGFCVDAYCCDNTCTGSCVSCAGVNTTLGQNGKCASTRAGTNPRSGCAHGSTACGADGLCDGAGACRVYSSSGTSCGSAICTGYSVAGQICNGAGVCQASGAASCSPFGCANGSCR